MRLRQAKKIWNNLTKEKHLKYNNRTIGIACKMAFEYLWNLKNRGLFDKDNPDWIWH